MSDEAEVEKIGVIVPVSEEMLRSAQSMNLVERIFGPDTRTDEQREADEERYEQERAEKWAEIAAEHARHVAATDGVARAVLELHAPVQDFHGVGAHCDGCDASGYEWEPPGWPCRTYELVTDGSGQ